MVNLYNWKKKKKTQNNSNTSSIKIPIFEPAGRALKANSIYEFLNWLLFLFFVLFW